jgi:hypothetical protein
LGKNEGRDLRIDIGSIEFWENNGNPHIGLAVANAFHELPNLEKVRFLMAAVALAKAGVNQILDEIENDDELDELQEMIEDMELIPGTRSLDS